MAPIELLDEVYRNNIKRVISDVTNKVFRISTEEERVQQLSDLGVDLGTIFKGNFIATNNNTMPDDPNFTGVYMSVEGFEFNGEIYNIAGILNGGLQFGFNATAGRAVFLNGSAVLGSDGIDVTDELKWIIRQTATSGGQTRVGKFAMAVPTGETVPALELSMSSPPASEMMTNGGFESGDFTGWNKTTEVNGVWSIDSLVRAEGLYSAKWTPTVLGKGYVKSLLHFDGTNGSTTMTDDTGRVWTARGNAQLGTAQKVLGTAALLLDGAGDYIDTPAHEDFNAIGAGDFEFEVRIRVNAMPSISSEVFGNGDSSGGSSNISLSILSTGEVVGSLGTANTNVRSNAGAITTNTWYTISFSKYNGVLYLRINGTTVGTLSPSGIGTSYNTRFSIGRQGEYNGLYFNGWIDEFIFLKGGVLHETDYTPATSAYGSLISQGVQTSNRVAVNAGVSYTISSLIRTTAALGTIRAQALWYNHPSAGTLIRTDVIGTVVSAGAFQEFLQVLQAPTGAQSAAVVLTCNGTLTAEVHFDLASMSIADVNQKLTLSDGGLYFNGVKIVGSTGSIYPQTPVILADEVLQIPYPNYYYRVVHSENAYAYVRPVVLAVNDAYPYSFIAEEGIYDVEIHHSRLTFAGIMSVFVDGELKFTFDLYRGANSYNHAYMVYGIPITGSGSHVVNIVMATKNSASTNFIAPFLKLTWYRKASLDGVTRVELTDNNGQTIYSSATTTNFSRLQFGELNSTISVRRALTRFPSLSNGSVIPAGKAIVHAHLRGPFTENLCSNSRVYFMRRVLRDWIPAEVTWNVWRTGQNWATAGASNATDIDLATISGSQWYSHYENIGETFYMPLLPGQVQNMYNGTLSNFGWVILATTETDDAYLIDKANTRLVVYYK